MIDLCLKFDSEEQALQALALAGLSIEDRPAWAAVDLIGTINKLLDDGTAEALPGWHVNVRTERELPELDAYLVAPATPYRVWL